ncbi:MAG TPA: 3-dehydroquinate synthase [Gemmatimonadaceae bacterium]|nr:3-dehydroquinate synthase [Gemmatimonadaceae bacterium]
MGAGALGDVGAIARETAPAHRYAIISDDTVAPLYAARVAASLGGERVELFTIPPGEEHKTRASWARLTDAMLAAGLGRDSAVIALGGGVVGDVAGFVAATYMRGIPVVQLPTTLLAMIDASIGGKTGVDTPAGKNLVGAFHQPAAVIADPETLRTLPAPLLRAGLAEAIKHGVIADAGYFDEIGAVLHSIPRDAGALERLIARSVAIKADVVRRDEREGGVRKILNFGHTIGHAVESESGYRLLHGEAVAIGMVLEARLAERAGIAAAGTSERIEALAASAGLPTERPAELSAARLIAAMRTDKKARGGEVELALPSRVGAMAGAASGWGIRVAEPLLREVLG